MKKEDGQITTMYPVIKGNNKNTWIVKANKNGEITYNKTFRRMNEPLFRFNYN